MDEGDKTIANSGENHIDMKVNSLNDNNHNVVKFSNGNAMVAIPVKGGATGEGLPYAPENWPCVGDTWQWKVGNRITALGYWADKVLKPPKHFPNLPASGSFRSRVSLRQYIEKEFPGANVDAFFASFISKVPASEDAIQEAKVKTKAEHAQSKLTQSKPELANGSGTCKVGNPICKSRSRTYSVPPIPCDICCSEFGFCRDCCCILCGKSIIYSNEALNFIKCEASISEAFICGHVAHLDCALRARLAGKVTNGVDLDAQYFCRRCDNKTDLLYHAKKIIKICESVDKKDGVEKLLNLGSRLIRNSEREVVKNLQSVIAELMVKHNCAMLSASSGLI